MERKFRWGERRSGFRHSAVRDALFNYLEFAALCRGTATVAEGFFYFSEVFCVGVRSG